jgi:RNA-directed DNA polymerase
LSLSNITPRESGQTSLWSFITRKLGQSIKETKQMTAVVTAGAVSHAAPEWHSLIWTNLHRNVSRLQGRIVKAVQAGRWGKVKALQHLLTHSFSAKAMAVKRVTENSGKRTPGVDGILWDSPEKKTKAIGQLRQYGYRPQALRRLWIPKNHGQGRRPLGIPCKVDLAMQALYLQALEPIAETTGDPNSYGFRKARSTADAIEQCFTVLGKRKSPKWVLEGDIQSCFDEISHDWLLAHIPMDKAMLHKWLGAGFMDQGTFYPTEAGTPQGGIASPVLAHLTLDGLERELRTHFPKSKKGFNAMVNLVRYCDDWIITARSKAILEHEVKPLVERFLTERGLCLSPHKTRIIHIDEGFDFLGQNVRMYNGKLLIKPSRKSVKSLLRKVREVIKINKSTPAAGLVGQLNPLLRGWANYHRHVVSKMTFAKMDHAIFQALWRWTKRRHPNKPPGWIRQKYFTRVADNRWVFYGSSLTSKGKTQENRLIRLAYTPIKRHTKIKAAANPYDPQWESYFEVRLGVKMANSLRGRRSLLYLWREQKGICPVCQQPITKLTGWHNHHLVWRSKGGSDSAANRVLLHPNCHRQVHSQGLNVAKPRPQKGR